MYFIKKLAFEFIQTAPAREELFIKKNGYQFSDVVCERVKILKKI